MESENYTIIELKPKVLKCPYSKCNKIFTWGYKDNRCSVRTWRHPKYCSHLCSNKDKYRRESVVCNNEDCKNIFTPARYSQLNGRGRFCSSQCWADCCSKDKLHNRHWLRKTYLKNICERCGFIPEDKCQLDLDHINGDSKYHGEDNLQTLCANCHRLKTQLTRDGRWKNYNKKIA